MGSKKGRLTLHKLDQAGATVTEFLKGGSDEAEYVKKTCDHSDGWVTMQFGKGDPSTDKLVEVFRNGVITTEYTFESIRKRARVPYKDAGASSAEAKSDAS